MSHNSSFGSSTDRNTLAPEPSHPGDPLLGDRVGQAVFWNSAMFPLSMILGAVTSVWLVRYLGAQQFALYVLLTSVINTLTRYSGLGLPRSIARFLPELRRMEGGPSRIRELLWFSVSARVAVTCVGIGLLYAVTMPSGTFMGLERSGRYLSVISAGVVLVGLYELGTYLLHGLFRQRDVNVIDLTTGLFQPILLVLFILLGFDVAGIVLALVMSNALGCSISWAIGVRALPPEQRTESRRSGGLFARVPGFGRRLFRYAGIGYLLELSKYLRGLPFASLLLVGVFDGSREQALGQVALLAVGYKLVDLAVKFLVSTTRGIYTPMLAEVHASRDADKLRRVFTTTSKLQILLCVPAAFGLFVLSKEFIVVLFGAAFEQAVLLTRILIVCLFLNTLLALPSSVLLTWEKYRYILLAASVSVAGVPAFLVGITLGGATGAALVLGILSLLTRIPENWGAFREFGLRYPFRFLARVTVASLLFTAVVGSLAAMIDMTPARLFGLVVLGVVLFLLGFRLLGGLDQGERRIIEASTIPLRAIILRLT